MTSRLLARARVSSRQSDGASQQVASSAGPVASTERPTSQFDDKDVQLELLNARLIEKDQLLYELFSCAHEMMHLGEQQKEMELQYMGELLADHFLGCHQVTGFAVSERTDPVADRRGAGGSEAVSSAPYFWPLRGFDPTE